MTKVTADREAVLAAMPYFGSLPRADLRRVAASTVVRDLARGEHVFDEGTPARKGKGVDRMKHGRAARAARR